MWSNARVNIQNVKAETNSAILVRLPNKSKYKDFEFWVSKKCVKDGSHSYELLVGINTDFTYKAKRTGKSTAQKGSRVQNVKRKTHKKAAVLL